MKVPCSDLVDSLLFSLSLTLTKICAGQPNTLSLVKFIFSPVLNCRGAALPHNPFGRSAYISMARAFAKIVWKDLSALPFSQGCSTFENNCFAPRVLTIHLSNKSFRNSPPLSNCQVFNLMLLFRAEIISNVFLHAARVVSASFVLSSVMTTSSEISSTTVSTYL